LSRRPRSTTSAVRQRSMQPRRSGERKGAADSTAHGSRHAAANRSQRFAPAEHRSSNGSQVSRIARLREGRSEWIPTSKLSRIRRRSFPGRHRNAALCTTPYASVPCYNTASANSAHLADRRCTQRRIIRQRRITIHWLSRLLWNIGGPCFVQCAGRSPWTRQAHGNPGSRLGLSGQCWKTGCRTEAV
jgi:hypothetical protein